MTVKDKNDRKRMKQAKTQDMQENVYACEVSQAEATKMMKQFKVSNMKAERGMVELRIIADQPPIHGASVVEPTLEDVFLYYFGEKGGEME